MSPEATADAAARFWDANREKSKAPDYWMAHPACRQAINLRISGSIHEWPLDWLRRVHVRRPFAYGVSWGCGLGAFERAAIRTGLVRQIDAFDVSEASLEDARREAAREGIEGIHYRRGNFDDPELPRGRYDVVFFHASLHHVGALERLFRRMALCLKRRAAVYVDEYIGPSRGEWSKERLLRAQRVLDRAPAAARIRSEIDLPIEMNDPSEAIRSSEIPRFLSEFFDLVAWKPYGGQIVDLVMPCLDPAWAAAPEGASFVREMLREEDDELSISPESTHYVVSFGRLKRSARLVRPLLEQVHRAAVRRLAAGGRR